MSLGPPRAALPLSAHIPHLVLIFSTLEYHAQGVLPEGGSKLQSHGFWP
jgi:hypothetical protein